MKITIIFTCYNRINKTINCVNGLLNFFDNDIKVNFIIVDDNSTDGTYNYLKSLNHDINLISGDGKLFWAGGMRKGIQFCFDNKINSDYFMLVNDDVDFGDNIIPNLVNFARNYKGCVIVGSTCDSSGIQTYGMQKKIMSMLYAKCEDVPALTDVVEGDTFNANCVLIPSAIFYEVGNFDDIYRHSLADWDYGFTISRKGYKIVNYTEYVGQCENNPIANTWKDTSIPRIKRLVMKESIKGSPFKEWFYYLKKNYNIIIAIRYSISPYIRILLGK